MGKYENINLEKGWYKDAIGAILGTRKDDGSIVAFIPKGHKIRLSKDVTEITIIKNCDISLESDYEQLIIKDKEEILSITKSFKSVSLLWIMILAWSYPRSNGDPKL